MTLTRADRVLKTQMREASEPHGMNALDIFFSLFHYPQIALLESITENYSPPRFYQKSR